MSLNYSSLEQKIFIPGAVGKLEAMGFKVGPNEPSKAIGIICHPHPLYQGTMHNKVVTTVVRAWQQLGLGTLRFNFRGVGESEGQYDKGIGEIADLEAVLAFVQKVNPTARIWLAGFSFGAFISLQAASHLQPLCEGLISIAPALPFFDFLKLKTPSCSWLVVQGEEDELVPKEEVKAWYETLVHQQPEKVHWQFVLLPKTDHFFHGSLVELKKKIEEFMGPLGF